MNNPSIILKTRIRTKSKYQGKSNYNIWAELQPDDLLELDFTVRAMYRDTPSVHVVNLTSGNEAYFGTGSLANYLDMIDWTYEYNRTA